MKLALPGAAALIVAHIAGMVDLVALPVWVGALQTRYGFSLQQAGGLATLFLLGAVLASVIVATRLNRANQRVVASLGFAMAAVAFLAASTQTLYAPLAALHAIAGVSVGAALSMIHGAIGRSENPHRLFAFAGIGLGLFAVVFLGGVPLLIAASGGAALFVVFAAVMAVAAVVTAMLFAAPEAAPVSARKTPLTGTVWFLIAGVSLMTFNQAMVFSFVEVIGGARGFTTEAVMGVLIALGLVNLAFPAPLAAVLEKRLVAFRVVQIGPAVQAALAMGITFATIFPLWAPAAATFVAVQIFVHTFAFGLLARHDRTGRAVAATPAMLMIGSALGPFIGGALSQNLGFPALGLAAIVVAAASITCFTHARTTA